MTQENWTQDQLIAEIDEILIKNAQERANSHDGKLDIERRLSHVGVEDWFRPFTI